MAQPNSEYVHQESDSQDYDDAGPSESILKTANDVHKPSWNPGTGASGKESFGCQHCSKSFNRRENLSRHLKTHDSSPSHICQKCGKGFTRSDLLRRHEAGHERWDSQGGTNSKVRARNSTSKRRKVGFEDGESVSSSSNPPGWSPQQNDPRGLPSSSPSHMIDPGLPGYDQNGNPLHQGVLVDRTIRLNEFQSPSYPNYQPIMNTMPGQGQDGAYPNPQTANEYMVNYQAMQSMEIPFDFSSFLLPSDTGPIANEWFSYDFYSAMRETGNDLGSLEDIVDPNMSTPSQDYGSLPDSGSADGVGREDPQVLGTMENEEIAPRGRQDDENFAVQKDVHDTSPPNEASEEDKWPFQWNPLSRPVLRAHAITIPNDHPFITDHDPRFDITETTLSRLRGFLAPVLGREIHSSQSSTFVLPPLHIINVFIHIFFKNFSPQMPVLHHATVNTDTDLPPPLLGAMIIIGAIYSHVKHTRRFAIVLLDIVRWNLQIALECDNSLMRDPMIIYAEALVCHTGLWCGNKRAFELAEVVRGALVTYIRRVKFGEPLPQFSNTRKSQELENKSNINSAWRSWIQEESLRRLSWVIYAIDCQFPTLLNMTASISIGEVCNLGCPCDEEFWFAPSARNWKNLLGPATVPPSRSFSAAVGSFILINTLPTSTSRQQAGSIPPHLPTLALNPWSAFLVLMAIQSQLYVYTQEHLIARTFTDEEYSSDDEQESTPSFHSTSRSTTALSISQSQKKAQLSAALTAWHKHYSMLPPSSTVHATNRHFHASSLVIYHLSIVLLDIPLSDLQAAIGKDGSTGMQNAFLSLSAWAKDKKIAESVAVNAIKSIVRLAWTPSSSTSTSTSTTRGKSKLMDDGRGGEAGAGDWLHNADTAPYSLITIFLSHIVLWVFASVASIDSKKRVIKEARGGKGGNGGFLRMVGGAWGLDMAEKGEGPKVLFRNAAEMLTRVGTWGAGLNLALLLRKRAEM